MKLSQIAAALSARLIGDGGQDVTRVVHPADAAGPADLAVALTKDALNGARFDKAGAILVAAEPAAPTDGQAVLIYGGHERVALAVLTALFDTGVSRPAGVHPAAVVAADAVIGPSVAIGPHAVVGARSRIGGRTVIAANVSVGADVVIGEGCTLHPSVVIADRVQIGDRVIIHPNAVIGADGFSFLPVRNPDGSMGPSDMPTRIHSLGTVILGDDVEIGAGTTIDRATLRATRVGRGTKIDNQVQVGHNAIIGEACLICGQAGIAGSAEVGDRVLIGAGAGLGDHVRVGSDAVVAAMSGVAGTVAAGTVVGGTPAVPLTLWKERYLYSGRLKRLFADLGELKQRLEALEKGDKGG